VTIIQGDCIEVLKTLPDCSVDAVVTDPPYGLSFMGRRWDYDVPAVEVWAECLRVLKPGGHLLAFAGTRTQHRMAVRIEDAGFEIRDMIAWVYGSGFPKSLDVSKAIDKAAGAEREVVGSKLGQPGYSLTDGKGGLYGGGFGANGTGEGECRITAPATKAARQWQGWGTALKPALEPITVARKPLIGTVAANVLEHGTGGLNIDGCRVGTESTVVSRKTVGATMGSNGIYGGSNGLRDTGSNAGRWPANLIHDGSEEVVGLFPETAAEGHPACRNTSDYSGGLEQGKTPHGAIRTDSGSAARFFYTAKASKADRGEGNHHPTVKPTELMRYLVRLVTPPGGVVLDPFMGSGSTGKACALEGFAFIGIEREAEYVEIARARIAAVSPEPVTSAASVTPARHAPAPKPAPAGQLSLFDEVQT
jgi:site-specific DNA-methyltransferase (adenine-specific)